jgi:hypothetical protein
MPSFFVIKEKLGFSCTSYCGFITSFDLILFYNLVFEFLDLYNIGFYIPLLAI